ncbi:MAG: DinB family protein [Actinomycetota bacterium]|jgi:hypothetical protein|nr:DinB family protein [Actinomycetota bacterium]
MTNQELASGHELDALLRFTLTSQYHATLSMLRSAIEQCPNEIWPTAEGGVPFWRVAYHTLYYTHLYLQVDESCFTPWEHHQTGLQDLDDIPGPQHLLKILELPHRPPQTGVPYSRSELLVYWDACDAMVNDAIKALDLMSPDTGFSWHFPSRPKIEQHLVNIRHIQHHTARLSGRLHDEVGISVDWVGTSRRRKA